MSYETLLYDTRDQIAYVTLNRPERLNAINPRMRIELNEIVGTVLRDPDIRGLVLTGMGRAFSAGADLKEGRSQEQSIVESLQDREETDVRWRLWQLYKPTIAAINGFALGGGLELALCCDFRIAARSAEFGMPEINLGSIPGGGSTQRLPRIIGSSKSMHLIMTGRRIRADEALSIGLVDQMVGDDALLQVTEGFAKELAAKPPVALRYAKEAIRKAWELPLKDGLRLEAHFNALLRTTEDRQEGARAFREKRTPRFVGR